MDKTAFGEFLASLRNEYNYTQEQIGEKINVNYKTVSKWECGNCLPDLDTLVKLAQIYNVSLYELTVEYKRIKNPFISKNNIKKIFNKDGKKRFLIINITAFIFTLLAFIFAICCCIYTINNYNQIQIYEIVSADEDFSVEGMLIKEHDIYHFSVSSVEYIATKNHSFNHQTKKLKYSLQSKVGIIEKNKISFEEYKDFKYIINEINFLLIQKKIRNIENLSINIEFIDENNEITTKCLELILVK